MQAIILCSTLLAHVAAGKDTIAPWLASMRAELVQLGHDAEMALLCKRYAADGDGARVISALDELPHQGIDGFDTIFADNAILEGRSAALLAFQRDRGGACDTVGPDRIDVIRKHSLVPLQNWPDKPPR